MRTWLKKLKQDWQLPEIHADLCVHAQFAGATCDRCVDVCPHDAWVLDDEQLGIATERCNGCGLCNAICPETALVLAQSPSFREQDGRRLLLLACQHSGQKQHRVSCLHAFSDTQLIGYYEAGYRHWLTSQCDCEHCENKPADQAQLAYRVERINTLLDSRKLKTIRYFSLTTEAWQSYLVKSHSDNLSPKLDRRHFLKRAAGLALESAMDVEKPHVSQPSLLSAEHDGNAHYLNVPVFDAVHCEGCDACLRLCPHQAISLDKAEHCYQIQAGFCTACGLCEDVCSAKAIKIQHFCPTETRFALVFKQCQRCGVAYHYPENAANANPLHCRICAQTQTRQKLFSVYD